MSKCYFVSLFPVVSIRALSAVNCLEVLDSKLTRYMLNGIVASLGGTAPVDTIWGG